MKQTIKDTQSMMQNLEDRFSRLEQIYPSVPVYPKNQPKYEPAIRAHNSSQGYISADAAPLSPTTLSGNISLSDSLGRIGRSVEYMIAEAQASLSTTTNPGRKPLTRTSSCPNLRDPFEFDAYEHPIDNDTSYLSNDHSTKYLHSEKSLAKAMDELFETVQALSPSQSHLDRPIQKHHTHQHIHQHIHHHNHFHFGQHIPAIRLPDCFRNAFSLLKQSPSSPSPFLSNLTSSRLILFLTLRIFHRKTSPNASIQQISRRVCKQWSPLKRKRVFLLWIKWTTLLFYHLPLLRLSLFMKRDLVFRV
ncbi:hypothetical protein J3Q64DRAFT_1726277 [Phycomyces blakesleeanus]|uniref:Uncharacterized protein n=1 Tax=Phycomyces blakesleeanus TaxID=4837 RepID=A0ABR3BA16_PHYBL